MTLVLGGGRGTRLYPLTKFRAKPAVPLGGKYRLIDIPLSNCLNSGLNHIYVLTQFLSASLHRHIRRTYQFDAFSGGFVELLAAQQTNENMDWYQGTADAVRQNLRYLQQPGIDYVLILSGDQLYRMDYTRMIQSHIEAKADATIAALLVDSSQAAGFGIMRIDDSGRVMGFLEKPKTEQELSHIRTDPKWLEARGMHSKGRDCLASMGIYLFNRDRLVDVLTKTDYHDFGKEIFPASIRTHRVQVHLFDDYWEDIGTIKAFYQANLDLCKRPPPFDMSSAGAPIYTRARFLAPSKVEGATIRGSLISDGCMIDEGAVIENSIIGLRCRIGRNVTIRNSVIMGNDFYQSASDIAADMRTSVPPLGIGDGTIVDGAIVDKNCRIGRNVRVVNESKVEDTPDDGAAMVRDGILCVPKEATLVDNWRM
ncbi:MAG TPA: glucose-1-phosphate adenylyltransferase [Pirellulales bacterium]|nr:glucose-1-phosphate adenylyltransferase [Pirellulales bacterium]